ncbi:scavenger receptor cysteine-rich type 1 protein M130-like [Heterodontus francisci]|uniref:scavenger receptor cysteine-rich type 1 protein M130-like n=1 Tax=Heterodontus francisci TaxID=7792 RepID=UPI00355C250D
MQTFLTLSLLQLLNCRPGNSKADPSEMVKLRLVNGGSRCAGRVEIHYRGQWGTVNDYLWDLPDAAVVCRELGCGTAVSAPGQAHFGEGSGPIVTFFVECGGTEAALRDCKSAQWDHYPYPHSNDAGVICSDNCSGRSRSCLRIAIYILANIEKVKAPSFPEILTSYCQEDSDRLQEDKERLMKWKDRWQMKFNSEKWELLNTTVDVT